MQYYRNTLLVLACLLVGSVGSFTYASQWVRSQKGRMTQCGAAVEQALRQRRGAEEELRTRQTRSSPLRAFLAAWEPHVHPVSAKELGNHLRNTLATLATRSGLTSEGATVPGEPRRYAAGETVVLVQQVSFTTVGESLPALLSWLGAAEEKLPYARVEALALSAYASRSLQLKLTLLHPIEEDGGNLSGPSEAQARTWK